MLYFNLKTMECYVCARRFNSENALLDHLEHSSAHSFCALCVREFVDDEAREVHYRHSNAHKAIHCHFCEINFDSELALGYHQRSEHKVCDRCVLLFENRIAYKSHQKTTPDKHFLCNSSSCSNDSPTREDRLRHWETAATHKYTYCKICKINFDNAVALGIHQRGTPVRHHICITCNTSHNDHSALVQHWTTDPRHKGLYDNVCNRHFESQTASWAHKVSTPDKHHVCEQCRVDFSSREAVSAHWRTDANHKNTYDNVCNRLFDSPAAMRKHMQENTSQHGWCDKCSYDLNSLAGLRTHWETDTMHIYTYCQGCQIDCEDARKLQQVGPRPYSPHCTCGADLSTAYARDSSKA